MKRITVIQGHPDASPERLNNALAAAYAEGALGAGHRVQNLVVADLDFPLLRSAEDWNQGTPADVNVACQKEIAASDHVAIFYPLWMGDLPALLKGFLEQVIRPTFPATTGTKGKFPKVLAGKSARIVVTMGMPAFFYRLVHRAHTLKNLERNMLKFVGVSPVKSTLYGMVEKAGAAKRGRWLDEMRELGRDAL